MDLFFGMYNHQTVFLKEEIVVFLQTRYSTFQYRFKSFYSLPKQVAFSSN